MNLFILSLLPKEIAEAMMDKHVSKILLEAVQMLCTAKRVLDPDALENEQLYKLAHKNHPVTIWCRTSRANFVWTLDLIDALHSEWRFRYGHPETKVHKSYLVAQILRATGRPLLHLGLTQGGQPKHPLYIKSGTTLEVY